MKKYFFTFKLGFKEMMTYKLQMLLWAALAFIPPIFSLTAFGNLINDEDNVYFKCYFLLQPIIQMNTFLIIDWVIADYIFSGNLSFFLLKPASFIFSISSKFISSSMIKSILSLPLSIILMILLSKYSSYLDISLPKILVLISVMLCGLLLNLGLCFLVGLCALYIDKIGFLSNFNMGIIFLLSGASIPLVLFPSSLLKIVNLLPYRYMVSFPIELLLNKQMPAASNFIIIIFYILLIWTGVYFMFKKGIRRYEANGS